MALLPILRLPDPRLRVKAESVTEVTDEIRRIVEDMYETMEAARGVGLAATQVGIHKRIFVMDVTEERNQRYCAINPEIVSRSGTQNDVEGCLSVGDAYDRVERAFNVTLRALDINGKEFTLEAEALMAACVQHEIDHLNGKLFIDHLSRLKQERIKKRIDKLNRRS